MKNLIAALFSLLLCVNSSFALSSIDIPDEFEINQHWFSLTTGYNIETKTQKLGTLYRKFFSLLLTYEFFDPYENKLATARARFFSLTAHFDIYDNNNMLLGGAEEKLLAFFPTFDIYGKDNSTKLAKAKMNFWGTTFTVYDPVTDNEMAKIHRAFFNLKNDWTFTVINRPLLMSKNIDPRVLLTVIAFQGDREYWDSQRNNTNSNTAKAQRAETKPSNNALQKINLVAQQEGLNDNKNLDPQSLEDLANELEFDYKNSQINNSAGQTNQEEIVNFTDYCLNLVQSNGIPDTRKQAILQLLKMRFKK